MAIWQVQPMDSVPPTYIQELQELCKRSFIRGDPPRQSPKCSFHMALSSLPRTHHHQIAPSSKFSLDPYAHGTAFPAVASAYKPRVLEQPASGACETLCRSYMLSRIAEKARDGVLCGLLSLRRAPNGQSPFRDDARLKYVLNVVARLKHAIAEEACCRQNMTRRAVGGGAR